MKRSAIDTKDRAGAIAAVIAIHAGIVLLLLNAQGRLPTLTERSPPIETFDVTEVLPPEPPPPVVEQVEEKPMEREAGEAAPPNLESKATPIEAPEPRIPLPAESPVNVSPTPGEGAAPTQGAAPLPGPGTGAGGIGTGTGGGGTGAGSGGGGGGLRVEPRPASVIESTKLTGRDYPREVMRAWPRRSPVFVAVRVQLDGRATECKVNRSSGNPIVDEWTCRLVEQKVRFRPAVNDRGQPFVAWYGYVQAPVGF